MYIYIYIYGYRNAEIYQWAATCSAELTHCVCWYSVVCLGLWDCGGVSLWASLSRVCMFVFFVVVCRFVFAYLCLFVCRVFLCDCVCDPML